MSFGSKQAKRMLGGIAVVAILAAVLVQTGFCDPVLPGGSASRKHTLLSILLWAGIGGLATSVVFSWRVHRARILLASTSVLLAAAAFDVAVRVTGHPIGIPEIGNMGLFSRSHHHRYPALQTVRLGTVNGEPLVLRTNEDGFRSSHDRASFLSAAQRIAVIGDSFAFGLGVPQGAEFPARLEAILRKATGNGDLAVLNTGVVSYSPYLERLLYEDVVLHYRPQLVLAMIDVTDIGDDLKYEEEATLAGGRPMFDVGDDAATYRDLGPLWVVTKSLRQTLYLPVLSFGLALDWVFDAPRSTFRYYDFDLEVGGARETNQYFVYRHPLTETRSYFERTLSNLNALADSVRASGAQFVAIVIPRYTHWNIEECPDNWESGRYALEEPHQYVMFDFFREAALNVDYPLFDLLDAFQATDEFPLVLRQDPHWNTAGHEFVARTLARELGERGLIPEPGF